MKSSLLTLKPGDVFRVVYPFVRCEVDVAGWEGSETIKSWAPGVRFVAAGHYGEEAEAQCDGEGEMILNVIDVHKPGRFPARVFFTRKFVTPDGKEFGKGKLHITTVPAFKRRSIGYMHEYEVAELEAEAH
jgi:hypothetical protein